MERNNILAKVCSSIYQLPTRILCTGLVIIQGAFLDYYLIVYKGPAWAGWIIVDLLNVAIFLTAFIISYRHLHLVKKSSTQDMPIQPGALPLGYIAWGVYAVSFVARIIIIFQTFVWELDEKNFFGPNMLKTTMSLSCPIFLLLLMTHYDADRSSDRKTYIEEFTSMVPLDILDSVEILDVLFIQESHMFLTFEIDKTLVAIASINFLLPIIPLMALSRTHFGYKKFRNSLVMLHKLLQVVIVNVPYFVLRLIIWHGAAQNVSTFLMKNVLAIALTLHDLYEMSKHGKLQDDAYKKDDIDYGIEDREADKDTDRIDLEMEDVYV